MKFLATLLLVTVLMACEQPRFERMEPSHTGISFNNQITPTDSFNILKNEYMYNGGGVGVVDLNKDGYQDLIFVGNQVMTRVYLNQGDFHFQDISSQLAGLDSSQWFSGVAVGDVNGDGWPDLYFTATCSKDSSLRPNRLWIHGGLDGAGQPSFTEQAEKYGVADQGYSVHSAFLDYDLDGDLDLYVLNNVLTVAIPTNFRPKISDGTAINNDQFYLNNGDGTFTNVTAEAGITIEGYGLGIAVGDLNKDGYPDLYISNDYISNDFVYLNQGNGTFKNVADQLLSYTSKFSMGNDMADINHDGYPDVMTLDMLPEVYARKKQTINGNSYQFYQNNLKYGYQPQFVRNMVQLHNGLQGEEAMPFSEVGQLLGVFETEWSWSPLFADFDNDGDRDLLITNGFPKDLTDKDFTIFKAQTYGHLATEEMVLERIPVVKVSNYAYEQVGDLQFENRTKEWGLELPSFSNGASFVDLDNDGDLDYVVNNIDDPAFIYQNHTNEPGKAKQHYLRLQLEGEAPNTLAIGAKVEMWANGKLTFQELNLSRGYISSVEPMIHFGMGTLAQADSVKVLWPGGKEETFLTNVSANQLLTLRQAGARPASTRLLAGAALFARQESVLDYLHQENDYVDFFQNQRILPHKFSMIGPCMAQGDLNNDGLEDLLIGASDMLPTQVFLRKGDGFEKDSIPGLSDRKVCSEADLLLLDVDGDKDNDLIALAGGYANEESEAYLHLLYRNQGGSFLAEPLPVPAFSASVVVPADMDKDGDLDLFIGARILKGSFPLAPASYVLRNDGGRFLPEGVQKMELGMVTDAVWSDVDGDGYPDLMVTREWDAIALLRNQAGKSMELAKAPSLDRYHGFWSAVAAVDLDQDGDEDYVLGNLGHNHRFRVGDSHPLRIYAIDIDANGAIDPVSTAYWQDENGAMTEYPVNYLDELASQSPFFRNRFTSYVDFSRTSLPQIFNPDSLPAESKRWVNATGHYVLWNEGSGKFRWEELPRIAQVAPVREMLIRDFTGDGRPDVLLLGNDHSYDVSTGYYDANRGLMLSCPEGGTLVVLPATRTGLNIRGQVESAAYFDGESPLLVVGVNRQALQVYRLLRAAQ